MDQKHVIPQGVNNLQQSAAMINTLSADLDQTDLTQILKIFQKYNLKVK